MPTRPLAAMLLCLALSAHASAEPPSPASKAPTWEQLMAWKKRVVDPFPTATYLDVKGTTITEQEFLRTLHEQHAPYEIKQHYTDGRKTSIVLRITPADAAGTQGVK